MDAIALFCALVSILVFWNTWEGEFVYDDRWVDCLVRIDSVVNVFRLVFQYFLLDFVIHYIDMIFLLQFIIEIECVSRVGICHVDSAVNPSVRIARNILSILVSDWTLQWRDYFSWQHCDYLYE